MNRINPWSYPADEPLRVERVTFRDPKDPQTECCIYLREPLVDDQLQAAELADAYFADWGPQGEIGFPSPLGQPVKVTRSLCRTIANLEVAQCDAEGGELPEESPDRYNNLGMAGFLLHRKWKRVGRQLTNAYADLLNDDGNGTAAGNSSTDPEES